MKRLILLLTLITLLTNIGCSNSANDVKDEVTLQEINRNLKTIVNTPSASSNPYDYIEEHKTEYNYLISKAEETLDYFLKEFEKGNSNGLQEYIMAIICVEILEDRNPVQEWESGQDWYNQYIKATKGRSK